MIPGTSSRRFAKLVRPAWLRYGAALAASAAALLVTGRFWSPFHGIPFMPAFLAVFVAGAFGGGGPGFLATVVSAAGIAFFFSPGRAQYAGNSDDWLRMLLFLSVASLVSFLNGQLWKTKRERAKLVEEAERVGREAEEASRKVEAATAELRQFLEGIQDGFVALDRGYRYVYVNGRAEQILGRPRQDLLGKNALTEFPLPEREQQLLRNAMDHGQGNEFETFSPRAGRWFGATVHPTADGIAVMFRDVTRRKQDEEGRERLAAIVTSSDDAIMGKSLDGTITAWNAGAERLFGYKAEEIIGRPIATLMPAGLAGDMDGILDRVRKGERIEHFETVRVKKNGELVPVSLSVSPIRDASGTIVGASKIARDITERRKIEAAILEAQRQLTLALSAARMGTWGWDIGTGALTWSDNLEEIHGLSPGTFKGTYDAFLECIHPEDRPMVDQGVRRAVAERSTYDVEFRVPFPDGSMHWVAGHGQVFVDADGAPTRMIGIGRDITERKSAEVERERLYREAQEAIKIRDAFLSVAGHELRTPLGALTLTLHNLARKAERENDERTLAGLRTVERQVERLVRLTNDLLEVGRISAGKIALELEPTDLSSLAREVAQRLEEPARRAGSPVELKASQPVIGLWDRSRLDQVVTNLLSNAIKFGQGHPIAVTVDADSDAARLTVRDQGIGISPGDQARIFERFERAVSGRSYSGIGLGLWITREIIQHHDGKIAVDSAPGQGATFVVQLPLKGRAHASADR